jgi:lysophospholipase
MGLMSEVDPTAKPSGVPANLVASYCPANRYGFLDGVGGRMRYACWNTFGTAGGAPRGTILLLAGRGEFIEKYATEIVGELVGRRFAVIALDWRGQGLSDRLLADRDKGHIDHFTTYMADLRRFIAEVVMPQATRPVVALCHSMGGHILLRHLAENGAEPLSAALIVSPMTALQREAFLRSVLMLMPEMPAVDHRYLFGTGPFLFLAREFASNHVTHDEWRYRFTEAWFKADPRLSLGGPTIGWARQAVRSMSAALAPGYLERIELPLLLMSAGQDQLIDIASHSPVVARLKHGEHVTVEGAKHEIMMETDPLRAQFWQAFDRLADRWAR